jgi:hypothetical protein
MHKWFICETRHGNIMYVWSFCEHDLIVQEALAGVALRMREGSADGSKDFCSGEEAGRCLSPGHRWEKP